MTTPTTNLTPRLAAPGTAAPALTFRILAPVWTVEVTGDLAADMTSTGVGVSAFVDATVSWAVLHDGPGRPPRVVPLFAGDEPAPLMVWRRPSSLDLSARDVRFAATEDDAHALARALLQPVADRITAAGPHRMVVGEGEGPREWVVYCARCQEAGSVGDECGTDDDPGAGTCPAPTAHTENTPGGTHR